MKFYGTAVLQQKMLRYLKIWLECVTHVLFLRKTDRSESVSSVTYTSSLALSDAGHKRQNDLFLIEAPSSLSPRLCHPPNGSEEK